MKKKQIIAVSIDFSLVAVVLLLRSFIRPLMSIMPECAIASAGYPCGSCGGTRCVASIVKGDFLQAFNYNQFFFIAFCYVAILLVVLNLAWLFKVKFAEKLLRIMAHYRAVIVFAIGYAAFTAARFISYI